MAPIADAVASSSATRTTSTAPCFWALAEQLKCDPGDILDFECQLCDTQPSAVGGARNEYVFSGRLDNLQSCHASLCALIRASSDASLEDEHLTRMLVHYDHEEVGSDSAQGAGSSMTEDALRRVTRALARVRRVRRE